MVSNFAYLIETYGHIPNGNRTYYLGGPSHPFFPVWWNCWPESRATVFTSVFFRLWKWNMHSGWMVQIKLKPEKLIAA